MAAPIELLGVIEKKALETFNKRNINVKKIAVVRKSDRFSSGDIVIPAGCHEKQDDTVLCKLRETLFEDLKRSGVPVTKISGDDFNSVAIYLDRNSIFKETVGLVTAEKERYGLGKEKKDETVILCNESLLKCGKSDNADDISLEDLRSFLMQEHITHLLQSQSYNVLQLVEKKRFETLKSLFSQFGTGLSYFVEAAADTDTDKPEISEFLKCPYITRSDDNGKSNGGKYKTEGTCERPESEKDIGLVYEFDMKKYLQEKGLTVGKTGFDKNLSMCEVFSCDAPTELLNTSVLINNIIKDKNAKKCLHITGQSCAFSRQKVHLILQEIVEKNSRCISQKHFVYGPVTRRQECSDSNVVSADDLFRLRYAQLRQAAIMKYGEAVHGEGWAATLEALTAACIKFEMLSCVPRNTLKLDLSEEDMEGSGLATSVGSFVMYNCARLATLFKHFEEEVECDTYPPLPPVSDVDFSMLREEAEWSLLFNYVYTFPELVEQTVDNVDNCDTICAKIHTQKVCQMLSSLSRSLSSYYSRYHVLGEPRAQLLPTMYARLYLLKAVHQVMINGLASLGIQPLSQL
ncbi:DALR anticodon-binding domain-containing protein 3-like [Mercenaria mercenaria]|uniref:DALR anticodon-binding domain-containing protein 3-like n=1 Tax=Mercenaria mercenaria TaxID=6596 RepID=UPI00234EA1D0|nr:DALR anticodon-binding domain-containing protein 3-like [Mercenaria mercenaria]